jgi:beta-N-acetylhexosaminidase
MIAQMVMVGFRGLTLTEDNPIVQDIRERQIGGVFLFDYDVPTSSYARNIQSPSQVRALTAEVQNLAAIPLLIGIDQEGGRVARLKESAGFPATASAQYLGSADDLALTRQYAEQTASLLADLGVNLNLAPVVDLNLNPQNPVIGKLERSFSADPAIVTRHALEVLGALHGHGVLGTLKHFPGHGSSTGDSHLGIADVTGTWSFGELEPYRKVIAAGQADVVMTAHIYNAKLDPVYPATLSRSIITGLLREELGYEGVVMSDDLRMGAIRRYYGFETAIRLAVEAGVDILALANNLEFAPDLAARAMAVVKRLVQDGAVTETRIQQSYARILQLKHRLRISI